MKIKSIILAAIALFAVSTTAMAKPVKPGQWKVITLANGTQVRAEIKGDEFVQFYQSEDGRCFERTSDGQYIETSKNRIANKANEARLAEKQRIAKLMGNETPKTINIGSDHAPFVGSKRCLCILMEYKDLKFNPENDNEAFSNLINEIGYSRPEIGHNGSVRDYFLAQSNGQFDMEFDVVGPYTTKNNFAYYGSHTWELAEEAVTAANPDVNYKDYDWDGDGKAEPIFIVYAGPAKSDHGDDPEYADYIWPHASTIWKYLDGVTITNYACGAEIDADGSIDGIGTMCHEYSHCLGLPDTYDVDYECDVPGPGDWDLMHAGCYNGGGNIPAPYNAYERMYCGWITPTELQMDTHVENFAPISETGEAYIYRNDKNSNEYYLFEVHGTEGFDAGLPGPGMVVYHIDFNKNIWSNNAVNCFNRAGNDHSRISILAANNNYTRNTAAQAYPNGGNNRITFYNDPTMAWFKNDSKGHDYAEVCLYNITRDSNNNISFDVAADLPKTPAPEGAIFYESFDRNDMPNCKGGRDGKYTTASTADTWNDNDGWNALYLMGGYQCGLVGNGQTHSSGEYAITPNITLEEGVEYTLSFSAAPYSIKTTAVTVTVEEGTGELQETSFGLTRSKWSDFTTTLRGNGNIRLKFERPTGFYLDDILVMPSTETEIKDVTLESTNANVYNLSGQRVAADYKGIVIRNGKKYLNK